MNFFEQQDLARRRTRLLVMLFILAVIAIVATVNLVAALLWVWIQGGSFSGPNYYPKGFFIANTLITAGLIAGGSLVELFNLRDGGDAVAQMAGGRMVSPASHDVQERRLLNVVAEMALASSIACPKVYVLDREQAINAFAAGYNPNEAVVAVTRGSLGRLTRDELQGVVAHEFSHILNGDMRLNVRLIGILFGIQMIAGFGRHLIDFGTRLPGSHHRNDKGPPLRLILLALGVALFVSGYIGIMFGRLIKSAVSRQREFLADASAVQFTRNPDGIGHALRKIGGLSRTMESGARIQHPNAEHLSHLFLSAVKPDWLTGMFATHPPIGERLRRIYGKSVALLDAPELSDRHSNAPLLPDIPYPVSGFAEAAPAIAVAPARNDIEHTYLPPELDSAVRDPQAAWSMVYALLLERGTARDAQMSALAQHAPHMMPMVTYLAGAIDTLPKGARLPLLDLAMPALRQLPEADRALLLTTVERLIAADNKITLTEFVVQTILARRLDARAARLVPVNFIHLSSLRRECAVLLSLVSQLSAHGTEPAADAAPAEAFIRGAALCPELGLSAADLSPAATLGFTQVRTALDRANQLAPLAKPGLIKALLAAASPTGTLQNATADMLRAICAALDAPTPPAVAETYVRYPLSAS